MGNKPTIIKEYVTDPKLLELVAETQERNRKLLEDFTKLQASMDDKKIETFEELEKLDAKAAAALTKLASETKPVPMQGRNFGVFGLTSTGKSTIINKLIGKEVAKVGASETTKSIEKYEDKGFCLYDVPGRNDETSYFTMEFIAFFKALTARLIVITTTLKEMTKLLRLLDAIGSNYDIVVNKFDNVPIKERDQFKAQLQDEVKSLGLKGAKRIWYVCAQNPKQFDDWVSMVDYLTGGAPQSS